MIFQRIFTWMANELITKKLANSSTFQRFAQATHEKINQIPVKPKPQPTRASYNPYRISEYPTEPVDGRIGETLANFTNALKSNIQKEISKQTSATAVTSTGASRPTAQHPVNQYAAVKPSPSMEFKQQQQQQQQQQPPSKKPSNGDIWDEAELPEQSMLLPTHPGYSNSADQRPEPEYTVKYRQQIGAGDVYLGLDSSKAPGLIGCDEMVVDIRMPAVQSIKELDLQVTRKYIDLRCPAYKLILPLQFDVNSDRAAAQWVSDKHVLRLILPIERSLPAPRLSQSAKSVGTLAPLPQHGLMVDTSARNPSTFQPSLQTGAAVEYQLHQATLNDPKFKRFQQSLLSWINKYLRVDNVVVKDLIADMSDGKSLGLLLKRLTNDHPPLELVPMISDRTRRLNIQAILFYCEQSLGLSPYTSITADRGASVIGEARWSLEGMLACDIRSILSLLIDLSHHFLSQFPLPSDLSIAIKIPGGSKTKTHLYQLTSDETPYYTRDHIGSSLSLNNLKSSSVQNLATLGGSVYSLNQKQPQPMEDAFDVLFDGRHQQELDQVCDTIVAFVNHCMEPLSVRVTDLTDQMHDGVYLTILAGYLCNYFVPLARYNMTPETDEEKMDNIYLAFTLMESTGLVTENWRASDIVRRDRKTILRVLYDMFQAYSNSANQK